MRRVGFTHFPHFHSDYNSGLIITQGIKLPDLGLQDYGYCITVLQNRLHYQLQLLVNCENIYAGVYVLSVIKNVVKMFQPSGEGSHHFRE